VGSDSGGGALIVVTHVDVPPPRREETEVLLKNLAERSRSHEGNVRYDVFQQNAFEVLDALAKGTGKFEPLDDFFTAQGLTDKVVVKEGASRWQAESGQYLLAFEGDPANGSLSVMAPKRAASKTSANDWFDRGIDLEETDPAAALEAYAEALNVDPKLVDAHVNRGWLLHEAGRFDDAERAYRAAIVACGNEPLVLYNLGVLLADMERKKEAIEVYQAALRGNPGFADCHYNLALLCEELEMPREAIRHMAQYRKLTGSRPEGS